MVFHGGIQEGISLYIQSMQSQQDTLIAERKDRGGNQLLKFTHVTLHDKSGNDVDHVLSGEDLIIRIYYESVAVVHNTPVNIMVNVSSSTGIAFTSITSSSANGQSPNIYREGYFECTWHNFNLRSGVYECMLVSLINGDLTDLVSSAFVLNVDDGDFFGTGRLPYREHGEILVQNSWKSYQGKYTPK